MLTGMSETELQTTLRLLHAAKGGSDGAMNDLFARYLPRVRRIVAVRLGKGLEECSQFEDLVQNALMRAFVGMERFEARSLGEFRNWLARCAHSAIADEGRLERAAKRGGGQVKLSSELGDEPLSAYIRDPDSQDPFDSLSDRELAEAVHHALLKLNKRYREVLVLRYYCEMSAGEIAEKLGFGARDNARLVCHRALKKLKAVLRHSLQGDGT